jgi:hypothetical protein
MSAEIIHFPQREPDAEDLRDELILIVDQIVFARDQIKELQERHDEIIARLERAL